MKRIALVIALVLGAFANAHADGWQVAPGVATPRALNTPGVPMERANVTQYGNVQVTQVASDGTAGAEMRRVAAATTNPSVATATSVTVLAASSTRSGYRIQNNSGGNICCSESGSVLTGIAGALCNVIPPGSSIDSKPNVITTTALTCYQTSGGTITTITVTEW